MRLEPLILMGFYLLIRLIFTGWRKGWAITQPDTARRVFQPRFSYSPVDWSKTAFRAHHAAPAHAQQAFFAQHLWLRSLISPHLRCEIPLEARFLHRKVDIRAAHANPGYILNPRADHRARVDDHAKPAMRQLKTAADAPRAGGSPRRGSLRA